MRKPGITPPLARRQSVDRGRQSGADRRQAPPTCIHLHLHFSPHLTGSSGLDLLSFLLQQEYRLAQSLSRKGKLHQDGLRRRRRRRRSSCVAIRFDQLALQPATSLNKGDATPKGTPLVRFAATASCAVAPFAHHQSLSTEKESLKAPALPTMSGPGSETSEGRSMESRTGRNKQRKFFSLAVLDMAPENASKADPVALPGPAKQGLFLRSLLLRQAFWRIGIGANILFFLPVAQDTAQKANDWLPESFLLVPT